MSRQLCLGLASLVVMTTMYAHAQVEYNTVQNVRIYAPGFSPYTKIDGSPYVPSDTAQNGWLVNGTKRIPTKLRYNSYAGTVEYVQDGQILTPVHSIAEFVILAPDTMRFQRGFPATQTRSVNDFYQVLFDGRKTKLVKYISATVKSNNEAMNNDFGKKTFQSREEYYVWVASGQPAAESYFVKLSDGEMKAVVNSKKSLLGLFPQNAGLINRYLTDQKIKLKSWTEFVSVLTYLDQQ